MRIVREHSRERSVVTPENTYLSPYSSDKNNIHIVQGLLFIKNERRHKRKNTEVALIRKEESLKKERYSFPRQPWPLPEQPPPLQWGSSSGELRSAGASFAYGP